jgi:predicted protein tyrosine phosphatase
VFLITVSSHRIATTIAKDMNVILISNPEDNNPNILKIKEVAKDCLHLQFDDIFADAVHLKAPTEEDIRKALEWAEGKDQILCVCKAGQSRSSAMAYLVAYHKTGRAKDAIQFLDMNIHTPNRLIVELGSKIFKDEEIKKVYFEYNRKQQELFCEDVPLDIQQ